MWLCLISLNALLGIAMLEWALYKLRAIRFVNEERDSQYPAFRRLDVQNWKRIKFYPSAMIALFPRLILILICFTTGMVLMKIAKTGYDFNKRKKGTQLYILLSIISCTANILLSLLGLIPEERKLEVDYSYYLGKKKKKD